MFYLYLYLFSAIGVACLLSGVMVVTQSEDFKKYWWAVFVCSLFWLPVGTGCWCYYLYNHVKKKIDEKREITL